MKANKTCQLGGVTLTGVKHFELMADRVNPSRETEQNKS